MTLVSVIMAVHNGRPYLAEALASILDQSIPAHEIIVVDDGSTDDSAACAVAQNPAIRVEVQEQAGYAAAVNRGVHLAGGEVVAFLDADDRWSPDALRLRLQRLAAADRPDVVSGAAQNFLSPDLTVDEAARLRFLPQIFQADLLPAMLVRLDAFRRVGPLDEGLRTGSALDWVSRARAVPLRFAAIPELVLHRRLHRSNLGRTQQQSRNSDLLQVVRAHHARHKGNE